MNLSKPQRLIYDMEKFAGGTIGVICGSMLINGKKNISEIRQAVNEMYRINDALRIRVNETECNVSQDIKKYEEREINVLHFDNKTELDVYAGNYAKRPLNFYGNLCEINIVILPEQYGLLVKLHHIIGDAWTMSLLGNQFNQLMSGKETGAYSYVDYVENENVYLQSKRYEKDKSFFLEQFSKCDEATYLNEKQSDSLTALRRTFLIGKEQAHVINAYAQSKGTSAFVLFTAALSVYINRIKMNADKFYIGTAVLNRSNNKEKNTAGMFINTVPMLIELDNNKTFAENLSDIENTAFSVFRHQKYNYGDVLSAIRKEYGFTEKLYDVMISYQNAKILGEGIFTTWYSSGMQNESLQIHIDDRDDEGIFRIHYDFQTEKFNEHEIERLHQHILNLLFDIIGDDSKKLFELNILTAEEKQNLLYIFNDTAVDYSRDKCVHQLFEEQVEKTPDKIAVIACDKTLTYAELNEQANRIAHSLIKQGVGVGDIVAFALPRKSHLISAMLGILKTGAAYLPIDPDYPQDRIDFMIADSSARLLVAKDNVADFLSNDNTANPITKVSSRNPFCCIYTSGSTGQPKGVILTHNNIVNYFLKNTYTEHIVECTTAFCISNVIFDMFINEVFSALLFGLNLVLATEIDISTPQNLAHLIIQHRAESIICTPTKFSIYLNDKTFQSALLNVKLLIFGGEILTNELCNSVASYSKATIINGYGPTETTIVSSYGKVHKNTITIGKPIANTQIYIVDKYMQPVPIGVNGELCIAGDGVGAGYLNRPELTAEKFIDNPFGKGKFYKTGDLAYWREDGNIVYVGRNDFQVKIRGLRIELGEIENTMLSVDGISQAVVVVRKNAEGRQLICAFYTGAETDAKEIRAQIGKTLPKYMLPHIFTHLEEMPLTSSGKINRKALPEINLESIISDTEYIAPETQMQKELCRLIEVVLGVSLIGITDDFFDLGGDSLKAIEFVSKAHNEGIYFNLQNVFDYPTVKQLCECIENGDKQVFSFADVDFTAVNKVLEKNKTEYISAPQKINIGNILLTGATGYLGIHILANFLDNDSDMVYCLIRGKDKADSTKRMQELLNFYFGDKYDDMYRIEVICADLQKDKFGLTDAEYKNLLGKADTVINCAASVKHYGSYKYFYEANVETTKRLIDFCKESDARLIHTSTLSVSGDSFGDNFDGYISETEKHFYESSLYIEQPLDNVYSRSKFEAEKAVLDAMTDGLQANIMRMGNLTNRYNDGVFQKNYESNAFAKRVKSMLELGMIPDYLMDIYCEFTPVDEAANAVMTIVRHFSTEQTVFHINSIKVVCLDKLEEYFNSLGYDVRVVDGKTFTDALLQTANQAGMEHIFETFINDMDENSHLNYDSNIHIENDFTVQYLKQFGFEWSDIDIDYLRKYVEYFKKILYFG